ncbi:MAG: hypothetical protein MZV70_76545 [Desulfobacterales bacterium]|nr:hypothetical protein [Desulfobacterales bacterium]
MFTDRQFRLARKWSNNELRKFAHLFNGAIVNVSGWLDSDKEDKTYKDYFINKDEYFITNYNGHMGYQNKDGEINLDLTDTLPQELHNKFDAVFNHTTLEHIFEVRKAFSNICSMSKDIVILILPFSQVEHTSPSYGDYWRFTPMGVRKMFEENNFSILYESSNKDINSAIYLFYIASKNPEKWVDKIKKVEFSSVIGQQIGFNYISTFFNKLTRVFKK